MEFVAREPQNNRRAEEQSGIIYKHCRGKTMAESHHRAATDKKIFMENCWKISIYYLTT
jgi:hypothetical protein